MTPSPAKTDAAVLPLPFSSDAKAHNYGSVNNDGYDAESTTKPSIAVDGGRATLFSSFSNLGTGALGVGILSYPFAFASAGIIPAIIFTLVFATINYYTIGLLARYAQRHARSLHMRSYEELVKAALGQRAYALAVLSVWGLSIGALTGYFIILGDLATPVLRHWFQHDHASFFTSRAFLVIVVGAVIIFPLSLAGDIHALAVTSFIAIASIIAVVGVLVFRGAEFIHDNSGIQSSVEVANSGVGVVTSMPLCIFALCCHLQVIPVYTELPVERRPKFGRVSSSTIIMCCVLYITSGLFGYFLFGADVKGDVLASFSPRDTVANVAKILMVVHVVLAYPVALFPVRKAIDVLFLHAAGQHPTFVRTALENVGVLVLTGVLAVFFPRIEKVFDLVGATSGVLITIIFPAWMLLTNKGAEGEPDNAESSDADIIAETAPLVASEKISEQTIVLRYVPREDPRRRVKAIALIALGVATGAVSVGVSIYSFF